MDNRTKTDKKYRVLTIVNTQDVEDFLAYCKKNNKIIAREAASALSFYLKHKKNESERREKWTLLLSIQKGV